VSQPTPVAYNAADVLGNLIIQQLGLSVDRVHLTNQKFDIPDDDDLFVEVRLLSQRFFGFGSVTEDDDDSIFTEYQTSQAQEVYAIALFSRNESAFQRAFEVQMALSGVAAQQAQELYSFHIAPLPQQFNNLSALEASANLYRLELPVTILRAYFKKRALEYYDTFNIPPDITVNP
jgi:hypothetical protein